MKQIRHLSEAVVSFVVTLTFNKQIHRTSVLNGALCCVE
jgi:hypothetical protein